MTIRRLLLAGLAAWCASAGSAGAQSNKPAEVAATELKLHDDARNRDVPVVIYRPAAPQAGKPRLAIISHGYGGKNSDYSFIATYLASNGYAVASIQHELAGDEPLPKTGNPYETRKPSWERGVQTILFVLKQLTQREPELDTKKLLLIGHSHGGDTSMLFAQEHPELVETVISLDNRRMPIPRTATPRILSIRSSDQTADDGVIPTSEEQARCGIRVVKLPATIHNDMWDGGTAEQKAEIIRHIAAFLESK